MSKNKEEDAKEVKLCNMCIPHVINIGHNHDEECLNSCYELLQEANKHFRNRIKELEEELCSQKQDASGGDQVAR